MISAETKPIKTLITNNGIHLTFTIHRSFKVNRFTFGYVLYEKNKRNMLTDQSHLWNQRQSLQEAEGKVTVSQCQTTAAPLPENKII